MKQYTTRAYNFFEFLPNGILVKKSLEPRLKDEIYVYEHLPKELAHIFPRYFWSKIEDDGTKRLAIERLPSKNLGLILLEKDFGNKESTEFWDSIFELMQNIFSLFPKRNADQSFRQNCEKMYLEKTEKEFQKLKESSSTFRNLCEQETVKLNGVSYQNFPNIWFRNKEKIKKILDSDYRPGFIHGDLCFSNILLLKYENDFALRLVDPRGKFGDDYLYGDLYYDLAKLSHSTNTGYEFFIYDQFTIEERDSDYHLELNEVYKTDKETVNNSLRKIFSTFDWEKILLIEASIFIGMCARHYDSIDRQLAMYLSGVKLLNEVL